MEYNKKYFIVNSEEESIRLQDFLIEEGYNIKSGYLTIDTDYPIAIAVGYFDQNRVTWAGLASFYEGEPGMSKAELPWLSEEESVKDSSVGDYSNKYFRVNSEAESRKLQEFLFGLGYTQDSGIKSYIKFYSEYPYLIGTNCYRVGAIGWNPDNGFYEQEGNEYTELPPGVADNPAQTIEEIKEMIYDTQVTNEAHIWTDKHYNFIVDVSKQDTIKIDPYFISKVWKLGSKDESGVLFHLLKTIARFGDKNPVEREIKALYKQVKRLAELENVNLED